MEITFSYKGTDVILNV